ncbi:enoyl-ACP reductase FabI [Thioalkalivibrio paradoxus]|uniref:Enoyl-[acyl-carrier-protein] reductase [NADH] n=1 Tax=Thioalkalivibrio paradoxus ARh 1 TaxID=713585 RepID=W0DMT1_9GAMM|nr:enoyl-ACP reductase FabI [Thioalkalivibrio paradoxus]AHE98175.1 enoyl-ACP reductase [Thioalkalivibrio paradoxus ARh 1]
MNQPHSLKGKTGVVTGLANADSIAFGCARALHRAGADLILGYGHPKGEPHVRPLAEQLGDAPLLLCDVRDDAQTAALFGAAAERWGKLDFLIHSVAFAPRDDLHGRVVDSSREGFLLAMDISCHSFMRMAKLAEPLMQDGGCLITMSYHGAEKVIDNYGIMGPVKAALESSVRYMAAELGPEGIRVHAISPGPVATRAASGIRDFDQLLAEAGERSPTRRLVSIDDIGETAAFLVSDAARSITGVTTYVDGGLHIRG